MRVHRCAKCLASVYTYQPYQHQLLWEIRIAGREAFQSASEINTTLWPYPTHGDDNVDLCLYTFDMPSGGYYEATV
jgi:hypothetical protein